MESALQTQEQRNAFLDFIQDTQNESLPKKLAALWLALTEWKRIPSQDKRTVEAVKIHKDFLSGEVSVIDSDCAVFNDSLFSMHTP